MYCIFLPKEIILYILSINPRHYLKFLRVSKFWSYTAHDLIVNLRIREPKTENPININEDFFQSFSNLKRLWFDSKYCYRIEFVSILTTLRSLSIDNLDLNKEEVINIVKLTNLKTLEIKRCNFQYRNVYDLLCFKLTNLINLNISYCDTFTDFSIRCSVFQGLINLKKINCSNTKIDTITYFSNLTNLTTINISHCYWVEGNLECFTSLTNLQRLNIIHCNILEGHNVISKLSNLKELHINKINSKDLQFFTRLTRLEIRKIDENISGYCLTVSKLPNIKQIIVLHNIYNLISDISYLINYITITKSKDY